MVLHAFVDESYTKDWFFIAAAIARDERQIASLERDFRSLLREESERLAIPCPTEVHGFEIFQGASMWGDTGIHERIEVAAKVLQVVADHDIRFIVRGIDRAAQRKKYPEAYEPYPMILTHVMREVDRQARLRGTEARIVCDEIDQHDRHRAMLERHRTKGTPGYNSSQLGALVGTLEFVRSDESAMVQAADIVAYLRHRQAFKPNPARPERRARARLNRIIESKIDHDYCWEP